MRVVIEIPEDAAFMKDPRTVLHEVFKGLADKAANGVIKIPLNESELLIGADGVQHARGTAAHALASYVCS
jgi:hypothetical protein